MKTALSTMLALTTLTVTVQAQTTYNFDGLGQSSQTTQRPNFPRRTELTVIPPVQPMPSNPVPNLIPPYVPSPQPQLLPPAPQIGFNGRMIYDYGMQIVSVFRGSKAQQIGLEPGDVVTHVNNRPVRSLRDLQDALRIAARFRDGVVSLRVRNVRPYPAPQMVIMNFQLDNGLGPVVPANRDRNKAQVPTTTSSSQTRNTVSGK